MHRCCFVWTPTPPLAGGRTPRSGPVRVCVCSSFLAGLGGPASRARFGAPHLFLWPLCLSALLGPLRAGVAPFLVLCWPSACSPPPLVFFLPRAPFVSCFLWFPAPGALGLGALFFFPPPPPRPVGFFFLRPLCLWLSLVSGPGCPGPWRCVLFVWLASRFSAFRALSPRLCFPPGCWLLPGGCCPPLSPLFVSRGFCRSLSVLGFFFRCASPLSLAFAGFRPRVPWALALWGVCFVGLPLLCSPCALASFLCPATPLAALWCLLPPPHPFLWSCFRRSVLRFFFSLFRSAPPLSLRPLSLAFSDFGPRVPWALALCAVCFGGLPLLGSLCALASKPPPPFVSRGFRRCLSLLGFFFVVRPRCLWLFLVSGPVCPGPWRCVLFVSRAAGCGAPCFASYSVLSCGAAVCGVFCAVPGFVWRACVWLGSCAGLWWVLLCCFICALTSCVAAFSAGFFFRGHLPFCGAPVCFGVCALLVRCGAGLPAALLSVRCSLAPAALAGVLCCCLLCLRVCCWAWLSSVASCWVLVGPGVVFWWCAVLYPWVLCCAALLRVVLPGVALFRALLFCFALLGAVARCVVSWGAVRRPVVLCLRHCALSCLAALCVFCCGVLLPGVVLCAVCVLGCRAVRSLSSPPCAVLLCFPALPWCPAPLCCALWWCAAVWCCGVLSCCLVFWFLLLVKTAEKFVFN